MSLLVFACWLIQVHVTLVVWWNHWLLYLLCHKIWHGIPHLSIDHYIYVHQHHLCSHWVNIWIWSILVWRYDNHNWLWFYHLLQLQTFFNIWDGRWQNNRRCNHILEKNCSINKTSRRVNIKVPSMINFNNCKETKKIWNRWWQNDIYKK